MADKKKVFHKYPFSKLEPPMDATHIMNYNNSFFFAVIAFIVGLFGFFSINQLLLPIYDIDNLIPFHHRRFWIPLVCSSIYAFMIYIFFAEETARLIHIEGYRLLEDDEAIEEIRKESLAELEMEVAKEIEDFLKSEERKN